LQYQPKSVIDQLSSFDWKIIHSTKSDRIESDIDDKSAIV